MIGCLTSKGRRGEGDDGTERGKEGRGEYMSVIIEVAILHKIHISIFSKSGRLNLQADKKSLLARPDCETIGLLIF